MLSSNQVKTNDKISGYYVEQRVVDHIVRRGVPTTFVTQLRVSLITDVDTFTSSLMFFFVFFPVSFPHCRNTDKIITTLAAFWGHYSGMQNIFYLQVERNSQIILMSTEIVTSNDKQLQHKNQKQLEAKYCLDGKLQMKLS